MFTTVTQHYEYGLMGCHSDMSNVHTGGLCHLEKVMTVIKCVQIKAILKGFQPFNIQCVRIVLNELPYFKQG